MFSVIIPLYNKAPHIEKTIDSVFKQTCQDFELIVVNDGSTDNSLEIVRQINQLSSKPIKIFDQSNAGVSTARNNGANFAKKDYIAFLDADDWWDPAYLSEMKHLIEAYPDAGIYGAKYAEVKHGKKRDAEIKLPEGFFSGHINYFEVYARTMWMPVSSSSAILPRRLFLDFKGFKPEIKLGEDLEFWVRVALHYPVAFLNKVLVFYNQDVDVGLRGMSSEKFHLPENHFVYSLEQFRSSEQENPSLKLLLDRLRGEALLKYHLAGVNLKETKTILEKVDMNNLTRRIRWQYRYPRSVVKTWWLFKRHGSRVKQKVLRVQAGIERRLGKEII